MALWDVVCVFGEMRWRVIKIGERQREAERRRGRLGARDDRGRERDRETGRRERERKGDTVSLTERQGLKESGWRRGSETQTQAGTQDRPAVTDPDTEQN